MILPAVVVLRWFGRALRRVAGQPETQGLTMLVLVVLATGTVFYRFAEDLTWADATYFTVITLTTVGYGDISPATTAGKLFTAVYVLVGVGLIVAFGAALAAALRESRPPRLPGRD